MSTPKSITPKIKKKKPKDNKSSSLFSLSAMMQKRKSRKSLENTTIQTPTNDSNDLNFNGNDSLIFSDSNLNESLSLRSRAHAFIQQKKLKSGEYIHYLIYGYFRKTFNYDIDKWIDDTCFHFIGYFTINSNILNESFKHVLHDTLIDKISFKSLLNVDLLFRGSQIGFDANIFHNKCDNKSNILILIKTQFNTIIGVYLNKGMYPYISTVN